MIIIEDHCVECPTEMGCLGKSCPYQDVEVFYCDECGEEDVLYEFEDEQLCINCILNRLHKVEGSY